MKKIIYLKSISLLIFLPFEMNSYIREIYLEYIDIKNAKSPSASSKFNRNPKNVTVRRIKSIKKSRKGHGSKTKSNYDDTINSNVGSVEAESKGPSKAKKKWL